MTEDEMRDLFREMRDEPLAADSLARVRLAVEQRTQPGSWKPKFDLRWAITVALFAAASLIAVLLSRATAPTNRPAPAVVARQQDAPPEGPVHPQAGSVQRPQPPAPPGVKSARRVRRMTASGGALLIRIETPDPDVVILLVGDGAGS